MDFTTYDNWKTTEPDDLVFDALTDPCERAGHRMYWSTWGELVCGDCDHDPAPKACGECGADNWTASPEGWLCGSCGGRCGGCNAAISLERTECRKCGGDHE